MIEKPINQSDIKLNEKSKLVLKKKNTNKKEIDCFTTHAQKQIRNFQNHKYIYVSFDS